MLFFPIRYINNGEPLDQVTLNRHGFDIQENLEKIIEGIEGAGGIGGSGLEASVEPIPNTLALRDEYGTSEFSKPRVGNNPIRLHDVDVDNINNKVVARNDNGGINVTYARLGEEPVDDMDAIPKRYFDESMIEVNNRIDDITTSVPSEGVIMYGTIPVIRIRGGYGLTSIETYDGVDLGDLLPEDILFFHTPSLQVRNEGNNLWPYSLYKYNLISWSFHLQYDGHTFEPTGKILLSGAIHTDRDTGHSSPIGVGYRYNIPYVMIVKKK